MNLPDAVTSLQRVLVGIPDLSVRTDGLVAEDDRIVERIQQSDTLSQMYSGTAKRAGSLAAYWRRRWPSGPRGG